MTGLEGGIGVDFEFEMSVIEEKVELMILRISCATLLQLLDSDIPWTKAKPMPSAGRSDVLPSLCHLESTSRM